MYGKCTVFPNFMKKKCNYVYYFNKINLWKGSIF